MTAQLRPIHKYRLWINVWKFDPLCSLWSLTFFNEIVCGCCVLQWTSDQKAFLHIKVDPKDRDALRLLSYENFDWRTVTEYWYARVIFRSGPSTYILGVTLKKHVIQFTEKFPDATDELLNKTYVDYVQSGGDHSDKLIKFKEESTKIMEGRGFHLHKWHSNLPETKNIRELKMISK